MTSKQNQSVFSFNIKSLGFSMSPRDLSFKRPSNGLWSTASTRFSHPRTKCLDLYKASVTASNLPSTGLYHDSAGLVNLPPANTNFHPSLQHLGWISRQSHHFWSKKNPMSCLLQSVARQVFLFTSKYLTPLVTAFTISSLARSNFSTNWSSHMKPSDQVSGFSRCLNCSIKLDMEKE